MKRWFLTVTLGLSGLLCLAFGGMALADGAGYSCEGGYLTCNYLCYPSSQTCIGVNYPYITQPVTVRVGGCEPLGGGSCTNTTLDCVIDCFYRPCFGDFHCRTITVLSGCPAP
jgi:hypothetical protein